MTLRKSISGFFAAIALSVVAVPQAFAENSANGSETHNDALISESATPEGEPLKEPNNYDTAPSFPGGEKAMYEWLNYNIMYPALASEEGAQGKVVIGFIVEPNGRLTEIKVVRSVHPALDAEALRVVKKMPKWKPALKNGQPVRAHYNVPVNFRLK